MGLRSCQQGKRQQWDRWQLASAHGGCLEDMEVVVVGIEEATKVHSGHHPLQAEISGSRVIPEEEDLMMPGTMMSGK